MIDYIRGILSDKKKDKIVVDVNGIGYQVLVDSTSFVDLPYIDSDVKLFIFESSSMYGGSVSWYGFLTEQDREIFDVVRGISGINSKTSLDVLSKIKKSLLEFRSAILSKDNDKLTKYFGFTKKTAEKLVLGLKDAVKEMSFDAGGVSGDVGGASFDEKVEQNYIMNNYSSIMLDAISGLVALGYKEVMAQKIVRDVLDANKDLTTVEDVLRKSLKYLA